MRRSMSTLDRYGEGLVLGGITLGLASRGAPYWLLATSVLVGVRFSFRM
ncbi:MAG: hypothetical protein U0527_01675 [Candidatus Eisenbacteria bacterium]